MDVKICVLLLSALIKTSRCSLVIDGTAQKAIYVSNYCPSMKYCLEGAHVMCMYYDPHVKMGPLCSNPQNASMTPALATKLLDVTNAIRSKLALGKEKGKGGEYLPRSYGMFRLKWDNELATFAQVLANQCVLRHDLCRASKRFPDPGQTAGLVRFTIPDWYPVSRGGTFNTPGLSQAKIMYAVMQTLKSWYGQKNSVTKNMLLKYPDWSLNPSDQSGRLYMEMISPSATHMGCGVSAYARYEYRDSHSAFNHNSIQVICNYSARPRKGSKVVNAKPTPNRGFTVRCGCPAGSREDIDCLCNEYKPGEPGMKPTARSCPTEHCEPTVVLLPIFTVEDAPPDKLIPNAMEIETPLASYLNLRDRYDNASIGHSLKSREIYDLFSEAETEHSIPHALESVMGMAPPIPSSAYKSSRQLPRDLNTNTNLNRYYDIIQRKTTMMPNQLYHPELGRFTSGRKSSIFARAETFQLPGRKNIISLDLPIRKDVAPRKDFSNVQQLVDSYLKKQRYGEEGLHKGRAHEDHLNTALVTFEDDLATETTLNRVEEKVMSYNPYIKPKINNTEGHTNLNNKLYNDNENKLMTLLDTLEREVKHIELDGNEKEIFDAKIRKIYGTVVGNTVDLLTQKQTHLIGTDKTQTHPIVTDKTHTQLTETDTDVEHELMELNYFTDEDKFKHTNRLTNDIRKHNNHITDDERKESSHYNGKRANGVKHYDELDGKHARPIINRNDDDLVTDFRDYKHNIFSSKEDVKTRNDDKYSDAERDYKFSADDTKRRNNDEIAKAKALYVHRNDDLNEPLSTERRKYYQNKLDNIERRLHEARAAKHRNEHGTERALRRMRPSHSKMQMRPSRSKSQMDAFYMPDRARYVHGY